MTVSTLDTTLEKIAGDISTFGKFEPEVAAIAGFIPGAGPIMTLIQPFAPVILGFAARALTDIATSNSGDIASSVIELLQHLTKGQPNSPALSSAARSPVSPDAPSVTDQSASAQSPSTGLDIRPS